MSLRIAVLISGVGSNLLAIDEACREGRIAGKIVGVLADRPGAVGLERARQRGLATHALPVERGESRADYDLRLRNALDPWEPELVVLAGFMRILSTEFVERLSGRLLNIHPSLLPRHKGLHTHQRVLDAGDTEHGATVHYVTPDLDGGPAILQGRLSVRADDDAESLARRVQRCEHVIYPTVLQWVAGRRLQYAGGVPMLDGVPLGRPIVQDFDV